MFSPDADISPYDGATSLPTSQPKGPPRQIRHANTRLPEQSNEDGETASTAPSSPTRSKIGAAIAGTPCEIEVSSDLPTLIFMSPLRQTFPVMNAQSFHCYLPYLLPHLLNWVPSL